MDPVGQMAFPSANQSSEQWVLYNKGEPSICTMETTITIAWRRPASIMIERTSVACEGMAACHSHCTSFTVDTLCAMIVLERRDTREGGDTGNLRKLL